MIRTPVARCLAAAALAAVAVAARAQLSDELGSAAPPRIVVGADRDYPPYEFLDRNGQPAGFNVDLTRAVADVMGMTVEFRFGTWAEIRAALVSGEIDVLQGISFSEERAKQLEFAAPHAIIHHAVFARRGANRVGSLDDLRGKKVIVFRGGIMDEMLTRRGFGPDLARTGTPADALRRLAAGEDEYVAVAALPGMYIIRELQLTNLEVVAESVAAEKYGFAVKKGNVELLARLDEGLAILKKTGRYEQLRLHQQQLVQADKLAALGVLVSGVAHEINNPTGLLLLDLPTVKATLLDALDVLDSRRDAIGEPALGGLGYARVREELPRMLDEMLAAARRIKHIVDDLKDFARREDAPRLEPV